MVGIGHVVMVHEIVRTHYHCLSPIIDGEIHHEDVERRITRLALQITSEHVYHVIHEERGLPEPVGRAHRGVVLCEHLVGRIIGPYLEGCLRRSKTPHDIDVLAIVYRHALG